MQKDNLEKQKEQKILNQKLSEFDTVEYRFDALVRHEELVTNKEWIEQIKEITRERDSLKIENKQLKDFIVNTILGYNEVSELFSCIYPPYYVGSKLKLSPHRVGKLAIELRLDRYPGICRRIKRIKRQRAPKSATTLVFSRFGIDILGQLIDFCKNKPEEVPLYHKYIIQSIKGTPDDPIFKKSAEFILEEFEEVWIALAK